MFQGVADTATLKERANAEANAASSASSTEASTPASASTSFSTDKLMGALKNDTPEAAAATAEEALEVTVPTSRPWDTAVYKPRPAYAGLFSYPPYAGAGPWSHRKGRSRASSLKRRPWLGACRLDVSPYILYLWLML